MAGKTTAERLLDLEKLGATLTERLDTSIRELAAVDNAHAETVRVVADLRRESEKEVALLKREVEDLKKWKEERKRADDERSRRLWSFGPNVVGAAISVLGAAAVAYFIARR